MGVSMPHGQDLQNGQPCGSLLRWPCLGMCWLLGLSITQVKGWEGDLTSYGAMWAVRRALWLADA